MTVMRRRARRNRGVLVLAVVLLLLPTLVTQAGAALNYQNDEQGANDQPGQKDLTRHGIETPAPGQLSVAWNWDVTGLSGNNTGDACALFDTNTDSKVNFALCVTIGGNPADELSTRVYSCGDDKVDRCTSPATLVGSEAQGNIGSSCSVAQSGDDPFTAGASYPDDTKATCNVDLGDVGASSATLVNTCSYPSEQPNSDPSDCVLVPRDAFIKIRKDATPNEGSFPVRLDGTLEDTLLGDDETPFIAIRSDVTHSVKEDVPSDWALTAASCSGASGTGSSNGQFDNVDTITGIDASSDNQITCTFNDTHKPLLTVIKHVVQDNGGSAAASDWTMQIKQGATVKESFSGAESPGTTKTLDAGSYLIVETGGPSSYSLSYSGDCDSSGNITLALGDSKTCTLTNDDIAPKLTVTKNVVNDNGGKAVVSDFPLFVDAGSVTSGVQNSFDAGSHTVSETGQSSYSATISGDCAADGSITLAPGDVKACTITNDDVAAKLTVTKIVVNANGGGAVVSDFPLFVDAGSVTSGAQNSFDAGAHKVSETGQSGYSATIGGACAADGSITLAVGDDKACTITNDDIAAKLTVTKIVVTDNGGTAVVSDFPLFVDSTSVSSGVQNSFNAGSHTVSETGQSGYSATIGGDCAADGSITLAVGDEKACTITNDDEAATLIVKKVVVNSGVGTAAANDFSFEVNGDTAVSFEADGQNDLAVNTGTYSITEPAAEGYTTTYHNCSEVVIPNGGTATCTVTNTLRVFTAITLVCEGNSLHSSSVALNGSTQSSLGSSSDPSAVALCALLAARFEGLASGTYNGSITISP